MPDSKPHTTPNIHNIALFLAAYRYTLYTYVIYLCHLDRPDALKTASFT
jgi:hypothetical protein